VNDKPQTLFTWSGDVGLAYQVLGEGPDLLYLPPLLASVDHSWLFPPYARFLRRLASFSRLIFMDRRGWGCSDRLPPGQSPDLDSQIEDLVAVTDATNANRSTLFAVEESGFVALAAAASHPDLFSRLVLFQCSPVWTRKDDMPWEESEERAVSTIRSLERSQSWDDWHRMFVRDQLPSLVGDEEALAWVASGSRSVMGPGGVLSEIRWMKDLDLRDRLGSITAPTLVLARPTSTWPIETSRYVAERIPNATLVEFPGEDIYPWVGDWEAITDEIQEFVTGGRERPEPKRSIATVLFTDIVGSTVQAVELGDAAWRELLARHHEVLRSALRRHHGTEVDTTGDGLFATFDSAAEAVRCAVSMTSAIQELGIEIRAGVHTGEVEQDGANLRGIAVHIGARVMSLAGPNEVLVSSTVKDLAAGSGLAFTDAGEHELKGVPDRWRLYRVSA
jgi:class 3 adenylate cyclase